MGTAKKFAKEILVMGVLISDASLEGDVMRSLESRFGPVEAKSEAKPFVWTEYYDAEMGKGILRMYLAFGKMVDPAGLAEIKLETNAMEESFAVGGKRRVNLDPGLLAPGRLVLATTKDRAHRIPLGNGIYGELTMIFEKGDFRSFPWTYRDWSSDEVRALLRAWRKRLFAGKDSGAGA